MLGHSMLVYTTILKNGKTQEFQKKVKNTYFCIFVFLSGKVDDNGRREGVNNWGECEYDL